MQWFASDKAVWLHYVLCSFVVMGPLLLPGYILTLDLVFTPHFAWPTDVDNTYIFRAALSILSFMLPGDLIEKGVLIITLVCMGVGMHKLVLLAPQQFGAWRVWGAYAAGLLYIVNPFTYSRFMGGQYLVLLGYALMPFFVRAVIVLLMQPSRKTAWVATGWAVAVAMVSIHHIGMLVVVAGVAFVAAAVRYKARLQKISKWSGLAVAVFLVANSFWLVPTLAGQTIIAQATAHFNADHANAFATTGGALGAIGNVVRLQGFWLEERGLYILPQEQFKWWGLVMIGVWSLVGYGGMVAWRHGLRFAASVVAVGGIVAIAIASTPLIAWVGQFVPFVAGYREPHKFVSLLALAFAFFVGLGVMGLLARLAHAKSTLIYAALIGCLVLPLLTATPMIWGFSGQLAPRQYPSDWYALNAQFAHDASVKKILFLPWHQYMHFDFAGRIIANPAPLFFEVPTVAGDNPEYKQATPTVPNPFNRRLEQEVLQVGEQSTHLGAVLHDLGFSHVVLAKDIDFAHYSYFDAQVDMQLQQETQNLKVYKVVP